MTASTARPTITAAFRTPLGTSGHALASVEAAGLAAPLLAELHGRLGPVEEVLLGNCLGPGGNVARNASLAAGLGTEVAAVTVDRQCASGLAAIGLGAALVSSGMTRVLAGGTESASTAPWRYWPPTAGEEPVRYQRAPFAPDPADDPEMGLANDLLAEAAGITREAQDTYAARSHQRAFAAQQAGAFVDEIVPVAGVSRDERVRDGITAERLARFRPAYRPGGTVTAGNSCGINDGAAVVALSAGGPGLRVLAVASAGVGPREPGRGLVPATRTALERAGLGLEDLDVIEFNEAFAGQVLACCAELDLDPERVCPQGGALALGHPWGASGAVLAVRLWHQLMPGSGRYGLAAISAGGGQGTAMVVEACR